MYILYPVGIFYHLFCLASILYITYKKLFLKSVKEESAATSITTTNTVEQEEYKGFATTEDSKCSSLWLKVEKYMNQEEPWRNHNLTVLSLSKSIGSNRTSLAKAIQKGGYSNFTDYVASYRVREFCRIARENKTFKIDELFYQAGFKSRSTAFVQFKKLKKMTPTEYLRNQTTKAT